MLDKNKRRSKMKAIALTSHDVHLLSVHTPLKTIENKGRKTEIFVGETLEDWVLVQLPKGNVVPKVGNTENTEAALEIEGKQITVSKIGDVDKIEGLPEPKKGVIYISSSLTAAAAAKLGRTDVYAPARLICTEKDGHTTVVGTIGLKQFKTNRKAVVNQGTIDIQTNIIDLSD